MINIAVIGASGYTALELIALLYNHPKTQIKKLIGNNNAGKEFSELYPHLTHLNLPKLESLDNTNFSDIDLVFSCLPHGLSQAIIKDLPKNLRIIDLAADFRINDNEVYKYWYGQDHIAMDIQQEAVYGLTEYYRKQIKSARVVACPGCYPTSALLALLPLIQAGAIDSSTITIDSKSGVSGAGKSANVEMLFAEVDSNVSAYKICNHRHIAEIEHHISALSNQKDIKVNFTPHLIPMIRGIISTIYVKSINNNSLQDLQSIFINKYQDEYFVEFMNNPKPSTKLVKNTNRNIISLFPARREGEFVITSTIDNLVKGASGQAIQNMNVMFEYPEHTGISSLIPLLP